MSQAGKAQDALRAQKDARQKKILIVLAPLLVALLAWQGPGMLKAFSGSKPPPATPAQPAASASAPDPTAAAAPSTATGEVAPGPAGLGQLPDGDEPYAAGEGQLVSFDRFIGKDPFRQQISAKPEDGGSAPPPDKVTPGGSGGNDGGGGNGGGGGDDGGGGGGDDGGAAPASATLTVNGVSQIVLPGGTFPVADPIFQLVSVSTSSVRIGLVSGEFSNGASTITVRLGRSVTLVSQPDGFRYTIKLTTLGESAPQP